MFVSKGLDWFAKLRLLKEWNGPVIICFKGKNVVSMPGTVIKNYRKMRNYSQKWVASQMNISQNAYSKIENNITQLTVHHIKQLSKILDVPLLDLLKDDFEIHKPLPLPKVVRKEDLLQHIGLLSSQVKSKIALKHDQYLVALSLIAAAEQAITPVH